jgi:hypothetical protein
MTNDRTLVWVGFEFGHAEQLVATAEGTTTTDAALHRAHVRGQFLTGRSVGEALPKPRTGVLAASVTVPRPPSAERAETDRTRLVRVLV